MKKACAWLVAALLALVFVPVSAPAQEPTFTILVYLCGTDLETDSNAASVDIYEMLDAGISPGDPVNVVIETGGTEYWGIEDIHAGRNERWLVEDGSLRLLESNRRSNMGDASTLQDFITFGVTNYPADRYGLILWNHGKSSVFGVCFDEYTGDSLVTEDIYQAIAGASRSVGGLRLDFLCFDACLMANYEMAAYAADYVDYIIASVEVFPDCGLAYKAFLRELNRSPSMTTEALARTIADTFMDASLRENPDDYLTISVFDLSQIHALNEEIERLATNLQRSVDAGQINSLARVRQNIRSYGDYYGENTTDLVDLGQYARLVSEVAGMDVGPLLRALERVVCYNRYTDWNLSDVSGMSIVAPKNTLRSFRRYGENYDPQSRFPQYTAFISGYVSKLIGGGHTFSLGTPVQADASAVSGAVASTPGGVNSGVGEGTAGTPPITAGAVATVAPTSEAGEATPPPWLAQGSPAREEPVLATHSPGVVEGMLPGWLAQSAPAAGDEATPAPFLPEWLQEPQSGDAPPPLGSVLREDSGGSDVLSREGHLAYSLHVSEEDLEYLAYVEGNLMMDISDDEMEAYIDLGYLQHTLIDWDEGVVYSLFDGTWPMLEDQLVFMIDQMVTDKTRRSLVDVQVNGEEMYLVVVFDENRPEGEVIGYTEGYNENGMPVRGHHELQAGDIIVPQYYLFYYDEDGEGQFEPFLGDPIEYTGRPLQFGYYDLVGEGIDYVYAFCLNDIFGEYHFSDFIYFEL